MQWCFCSVKVEHVNGQDLQVGLCLLFCARRLEVTRALSLSPMSGIKSSSCRKVRFRNVRKTGAMDSWWHLNKETTFDLSEKSMLRLVRLLCVLKRMQLRKAKIYTCSVLEESIDLSSHRVAALFCKTTFQHLCGKASQHSSH